MYNRYRARAAAAAGGYYLLYVVPAPGDGVDERLPLQWYLPGGKIRLFARGPPRNTANRTYGKRTVDGLKHRSSRAFRAPIVAVSQLNLTSD